MTQFNFANPAGKLEFSRNPDLGDQIKKFTFPSC